MRMVEKEQASEWLGEKERDTEGQSENGACVREKEMVSVCVIE